MPTYLRERERLDRIDRWSRWQHEDMDLPRKSGREIKQLVQLAKTPWLGLVVTAVAQVMYVDGYRSPTGGTVETPWRVWQHNRMPSRQGQGHRAALTYGQSVVTVLPGDSGAVLRGVWPRRRVGWVGEGPAAAWAAYARR